MIHQYPLVIREHHLDTFGHVNNATYLELFEEARWELISAKGFTLQKVQNERKGPIILEINLRFSKELKLRETITIESELQSYRGKIGKMVQKMRGSNGEVAAELVLTFGLFDLDSRKLIPPTSEWLEAIGANP